MKTFSIALRNIVRNVRRSLTATVTIAIGALAMLLFGGYVSATFVGIETDIVQRVGHLHVYKKGYFDFGSGNPAEWGIDDYQTLMEIISTDPELGPMTRVVTPGLNLFGIAGNYAANASKTFMGTGVVASDQDKMLTWNGNNLSEKHIQHRTMGFSDEDSNAGVIGVGLARILMLCDALKLPSCPHAPDEGNTSSSPIDQNIADLSALETGDNRPSNDQRPHIDLLAATASGAPNVVSMIVNKAEGQGVKEMDDVYVAMPLPLAQRLVYGRSTPKATAVALQLFSTQDLETARTRLNALIDSHKLGLEVKDFSEVVPMFGQITGMFGAIFSFISILMALIVVFTLVNSMSMTVMERISEIGTLRALGTRRSGIRRLFLTEGILLGMIGATMGTVLALLGVEIVNAAQISYIPPGNVDPVPLTLRLFGDWFMLGGVWLGLVILSALSALFPANRAAGITVVDALRHV